MSGIKRERLSRLLMSLDGFVDRFDSLEPEKSFVYYRGHLAVDIGDSNELYRISRYANKLYEKEQAELTHRRIGRNFFEYIITKRTKPRKKERSSQYD